MKKFFLLLVLIAGTAPASFAQDTVRYGDPWYQFSPLPPLPENSMHPCSDLGTLQLCEVGDVARRYLGYENENNTIYGIAVVMDSLPGLEWNFMTVLLRGIEYHDFYIWDIHRSGEIEVDSCYSEDSIKTWEDPLIKRCRFEYFYNFDSLQEVYKTASTNCFEFYFDTPIDKNNGLNDFADTFFVGVRLCRANRTNDWLFFTPVNCVSDSVATSYLWFSDGENGGGGRYHTSDHPYLSLGPNRYNFWGGIFPIIERRCRVPRGLALADDSLSVSWRSDTDAELFQLSLCADTVEPDFGRLFTTPATALSLPALHSDSTYRLYLRKQCAFRQDSVWSDWSEPLLIDARPAAGIAPVSILNCQFSISPNPASGTVTVTTEARQGTLAVVDLQGRQQLSQPLAGPETLLDIRHLAPSTYIVVLTTPLGQSSTKLTVE